MLKNSENSLLFAAALAAVLLTPAARADLLFSGNVKTGSPTPTLNITAPFTLDINTNGSLTYLDIEDWVTNNGAVIQLQPSNFGQFLSYQIDGGPTLTDAIELLQYDDLTDNDVSANDGILAFAAIAVTAGQTVTFLPSTATFDSGNPPWTQPPADFTGNVFLLNNSNVRLSDVVSVASAPEPTTWALLALPAAVWLCRRRRRQI